MVNRPVAIGPRPLWSVLVGATGGLTWAQTSFGAGAELLAGVPRHGHAVTCLLAGAVLVVGLWRRSSAVLLLGFPLALLVAFATMAPGPLAAAFGPYRWASWSGSATAYLIVTSLWLSDPGAETLGVERRPAESQSRAETVTLRTRGRIALAAALLLAPAGALLLASPTDHASPEPPAVLVFAHLALAFGWCVGAYTFFIAPMLDAERERRATTRREQNRPYRSSLFKRVGFALVSVIVSVLWIRLLLVSS